MELLDLLRAGRPAAGRAACQGVHASPRGRAERDGPRIVIGGPAREGANSDNRLPLSGGPWRPAVRDPPRRYPAAPHAYGYATAGFALLTIAALRCGFHADAPAARLPLVPPGQALMALCVVMGASTVAWPDGADEMWADGSGFTAVALLWLVARWRSPAHTAADPAAALALAAVGAAELARRTSMPTLEAGTGLPGVNLVGAAAQALVMALLVVAPAAVGARGLLSTARTDARAEAVRGRPDTP